MRKILLTTVLPLLLALIAAVPGQAQKLSQQPGYLPIEELALFPKADLSVEINLEGALLRMVANALRQEDPEFAAMIRGLLSIRVQVVPLKGGKGEAIKPKIGRAVEWLEDKGWKTMLRAREADSEVYIYLKQVGDKIVGLTLLSLEGGSQPEAALINIVGHFDPDQLERLGGGLNIDIPQMKKKSPAPGKKPE